MTLGKSLNSSHSLSARRVQQHCPPLAAWKVRRGSLGSPQHSGGPCLVSCFDQVRRGTHGCHPQAFSVCDSLGSCRLLHTHHPYVLCPQMTDEQTEAWRGWGLFVVPHLSVLWDAHTSPLHGEGLRELWGLRWWDMLAGKEVLGSVP